jgi:ATP-dependent 26S proteasome regulatory subunit
MLREELQMLQEQGSYVGEVVKVMGKSEVLRLVKVCVLGLELVQKYIREGSLHGL